MADFASLADILRAMRSSDMVKREEKVFISADGLGRVAIVERSDGRFCLYSWWHLSAETKRGLGFQNPTELHCTTDFDSALYYDAVHDLETSPVPGVYGRMEDAETEALQLFRGNDC